MVTKTDVTPLQDRWAHLRTHQRVISKVKLLIEWDEEAERRRVNAVTVDVSRTGCMAVVPAELHLHQRVSLIHAGSGRKAEAEVVWRGHEAWEVGLELAEPDPSFWGVKF
jgi:hypothetical protein